MRLNFSLGLCFFSPDFNKTFGVAAYTHQTGKKLSQELAEYTSQTNLVFFFFFRLCFLSLYNNNDTIKSVQDFLCAFIFYSLISLLKCRRSSLGKMTFTRFCLLLTDK